MAYKREGNTITITLEPGQYSSLMMILGYATGAMSGETGMDMWIVLELANAINEGNPDFGPYSVPPYIECPKCGRRSYNVNDIERKYCGACHMFHDQMEVD